MATRFIDALDSNGNVVSTFAETDDTVMAWSPNVIFPTLPAGTYTFVQRTGKTTPPYVVEAVSSTPSITASDSLSGRVLTISVDTVTGVPAPAVSLTALTLDGVNVLGAHTGTGPWSYDTPEAATDQTVAWTVTATNSEGTDTASGMTVVAASAAPSPLLLDEYPGAYRAYSLQQVRAAYTGPVIRARRSDDNAELDFTATEVADGSMLAWATTNAATSDARLVTWYDQSLNAVNSTAFQAAAQPYLVVAGVQVVGVNGLPAVSTVDTAVGVDFDGLGMTVQDNCILTVAKRDPALVAAGPPDAEWAATFITDWERKQELFIGFELGFVFGFQGLRASGSNDFHNMPAGTTEGLFMINVAPTASGTGTPQGESFVNGASLGTVVLSSQAETRTDHRYPGSIGQYRDGGESSNGSLVSEVIAYASSQPANVGGINAEVAARYGITLS